MQTVMFESNCDQRCNLKICKLERLNVDQRQLEFGGYCPFWPFSTSPISWLFMNILRARVCSFCIFKVASLQPVLPIASMSTGTVTCKPLSRANAVIISRKPSSCVGNQQPSAAKLKRLGIKVRDFASEKTLPPARTVHFHRQILPGVTRQTITRQKTEEDVSRSQQSHSGMRRLDRIPTEPSLTPAPPKGVDGM